jgi:hypothetical protein
MPGESFTANSRNSGSHPDSALRCGAQVITAAAGSRKSYVAEVAGHHELELWRTTGLFEPWILVWLATTTLLYAIGVMRLWMHARCWARRLKLASRSVLRWVAAARFGATVAYGLPRGLSFLGSHGAARNAGARCRASAHARSAVSRLDLGIPLQMASVNLSSAGSTQTMAHHRHAFGRVALPCAAAIAVACAAFLRGGFGERSSACVPTHCVSLDRAFVQDGACSVQARSEIRKLRCSRCSRQFLPFKPSERLVRTVANGK